MHELFFVTKSFTLRPFRVSDAYALRKNIQDEDIFFNTLRIPRPYLLQHAKEHIAKNLKQYRMAKPASIGFVIEVEGEAAGAIGVTFRGPTGEIGYWLAKKHWGQGLMTEIVGVVCDHLFQTYHLQKIIARVFVYNIGSTRVLQKNNFRRSRRITKGERKEKKWIPIYEFSKTGPRQRIDKNNMSR